MLLNPVFTVDLRVPVKLISGRMSWDETSCSQASGQTLVSLL